MDGGVETGDGGSSAKAATKCAHDNGNGARSGAAPSTSRATVTLQYVEIYQNQVTDLMSGRAVQLMDTGRDAGTGQFMMRGATEKRVENVTDVVEVLRVGEARKRFAATKMNSRSSRAHTVLVVAVTQSNGGDGAEGGGSLLTSHLHLVDLAGSERIKKSGAEGDRRAEAVGINRSLMVLGQCINALVEQKRHVPYYESKLTMLLKRAIGGNSRTTAVVTCRVDDDHAEETLQVRGVGERVEQRDKDGLNE